MMKDVTRNSKLRAVGYVRVSTRRQADHQISLVEQQKAITRFCDLNGIDLLDIYIEPGASAKNDRRPEFQRMIADATATPKRFDLVLIFNFSRFFRDDHEFESYRRRLAAAGVDLQSVTQQISADPGGNLLRRITTSFDAYSSEVNGVQTKAAMTGNAEAGYWNGSLPPFGYRTQVVGKFNKKEKKQLVIEPDEARIVELIFDLYLNGDATCGPMGVLKLTEHLNDRNLRIRNKPFRTGTVHDMLRRETYAGTHYYNRTNSVTRQARPREEWIAIDVPAIINRETFDRVQQRLAKHRPQVTAPRSVNSPTLLAGIAKCGHEGCGSGMILLTGKSGQYRYLICDKKRTQSKAACGSRNAPMLLVDGIVLSTLEEQILKPERLADLLSAVLDRSDQALATRRADLKNYRAEKTRIEAAKRNLLELVETGSINPRDPQFVERMSVHNARLATVDAEIRTIERQLASPTRHITPAILEKFSGLMRKKLRDPNPALRQGYVRLLLDEVVIDDDLITMRGSKKALEHAIFAKDAALGEVPTFIRDWRARQDSNLWPPD